MIISWLTFLGLCLNLNLGSALQVPQHNCERYFSYYQEHGGDYIGVFTAPRSGISSLSWEVVFTAHGTGQANTVSSLHPYPTKEKAFENIHNGERGQVYLRFQNFGNELPKLTRAEFNDELLCRNDEYDAPSSTMTRRQSMSTSTPIRQNFVPNQTVPQSLPNPKPNPKPNPFLPQNKPKIESDFEQCGVEGFAPLQIGGDLVTRGQYPWLAALYEGGATATYKCVVSVISKRTVITAAHCIYGKSASQLWVYLGRHDRYENPENGASLVSVSSVLTPSAYEGSPVPDSDVGLLVLNEAMVYTKYIQPLCLWTSNMGLPPNEGDTGAVAGWGYDRSAQKTRFPKTVSVRLVPRDQCLKEMKRAEDFITRRTVCAGNSESHGPCFGDSGSALIVLRNNRWYIRGVVSLSPRQGDICDLSKYVIYCDVAKHLDWVRQNMVM
ncbi:LOW QUALITY PROTEIN: serine protease gd [Drosophila eugracilis]|uniref:LOW QUALITY PROTEIN: serine protease gd n=1 Tax=Drosophila eugracilis TaxID=29029 RepID=UPI001BDB35E6|nr:LOW QUALITY PROTEIN: serine protease gd [Drosophila eugracilis]